MTGTLRDLLRESADSFGSPDLDLDDLVAQGERRLRHRRRGVVAASVVAVALIAGTALLTGPDTDKTGPANPTPPTQGARPVDIPRPLTYAIGETLHYGEQTIETGLNLEELDVTDDGVAFRADDDERIFFTDGSDPVEIGRASGRFLFSRAVVAGSAGSLLAWLGQGEVVVYDTHERRVVARAPYDIDCEGCFGPWLWPPHDGSVYWSEYEPGGFARQMVRYDVSKGTQTRVSPSDYRAALQGPRALLVGDSITTDFHVGPLATWVFLIVDTRLEAESDNGERAVPVPYFDPVTGSRLQLSLPQSREDGVAWFAQWLDDDRFTVVTSGGHAGGPSGDLLVCRISAGDCRVAVLGSAQVRTLGTTMWLLPGFGGHGTED